MPPLLTTGVMLLGLSSGDEMEDDGRRTRPAEGSFSRNLL